MLATSAWAVTVRLESHRTRTFSSWMRCSVGATSWVPCKVRMRGEVACLSVGEHVREIEERHAVGEQLRNHAPAHMSETPFSRVPETKDIAARLHPAEFA